MTEYSFTWLIWCRVLTAAFFLAQGFHTVAEAKIVIDDGQRHVIDDTESIFSDGVELDLGIFQDPSTHFDLVEGGSLLGLGVHGNATVTMTGGEVETDIVVTDNARVTISGGSIGARLANFSDNFIYLNGTGFQVVDQAGIETDLHYGDSLSDYVPFVQEVEFGIATNYYTGTIRGVLADGSIINNRFDIFRNSTFGGSGDIIVLPEPGTLILLSLGGFLFRRETVRR
ncbi:hypothetical protein STSP2_00952 [Anaerohalosphaera lusitana]|uniref:PEP-CTERM protein-sorting domain-containing protein n=1 Tax=Anaerohalosphaera lusitana TaxID=1936003 RepID=A0A1U9NIP0_9BACT|nr:PEP-CTERM sorting domain-containing protein [Anaerohalosphaera lusitana]AQT67802.1 hypothetical protein STSP2_00952 [Anaerohalosphaera lusitana]